MKKILLVDDDPNIRLVLTNLLKHKNYDIVAVSSAEEAINEVKKNNYDLVLLDVFLPDRDGIVCLKEIKQIDKEISVIVISAYGEVRSAIEAIKLGASDYLTKPVSNEEIILVIEKVLKEKKLINELEYLRKEAMDTLLGKRIILESKKIKEVFDQAVKIAKTNYTIFIFGETGVGKEVLAYWIHKNSFKKDGPFIIVDCGSLPKEIIEAELFGYEKGAFTGAEKRNIGKIELADEGTLFLDEIGNLPLDLQPKFLRVVEEKKFYRLGGSSLLDVDVRYICASNTSLEKLVEEGRFRSDLYYRLSEFKIEIPPLRERKEDIVPLANFFLLESNREMNKSIKYIDDKVKDLLLDYNWPGNIRELRNVIRTAAFFAHDVIKREHIENILLKNNKKETGFSSCNFKSLNLKENIENLERNLIEYVLKKENYNKDKTAKVLGITRKTLYDKLKKYSLSLIQ